MDPDLQMRGRGHPHSEIRGGEPSLTKKVFTSFWSKNKGGWAPLTPPLDPPLNQNTMIKLHVGTVLKTVN